MFELNVANRPLMIGRSIPTLNTIATGGNYMN